MHVPGSRLQMRGVSGIRDGERTEVTTNKEPGYPEAVRQSER